MTGHYDEAGSASVVPRSRWEAAEADCAALRAEMAKRDALAVEYVTKLRAEMARFLPVIARAEADPDTWARLTEGTGIATANAYRAVLAARGDA